MHRPPADLQSFAAEVARLARLIDAPASVLPTFGRTEDFARPHIEFDGRQFHYVVIERGQELRRESSDDPDDILFHVFDAITSEMAGHYECRHRRPDEDSRRQLFAVHLDLLGRVSAAWRQRAAARLNNVLQSHPFVDAQD